MAEGREEIPWAVMTCILVLARFCAPSSELSIAESWYDKTALDDLPEVMKHVGFPQGIPMTLDEMRAKPFRRGETEFDQLLVIEIKATGQAIGECKLSRPNDDGIAEPDIKLLPIYWGYGYGSEAWKGIVSYLFRNTDCDVIMTTPNVDNTAAIKMYKAAGAVQVGEGEYQIPERMREYTTPVHCYQYQLRRSDWQQK